MRLRPARLPKTARVAGFVILAAAVTLALLAVAPQRSAAVDVSTLTVADRLPVSTTTEAVSAANEHAAARTSPTRVSLATKLRQ